MDQITNYSTSPPQHTGIEADVHDCITVNLYFKKNRPALNLPAPEGIVDPTLSPPNSFGKAEAGNHKAGIRGDLLVALERTTKKVTSG